MSTHNDYPFVPFEPRLGRSVSLGQAAEMLHVSIRTVYYWIREGRLRTVRTLNGSQRVLLDSLAGASDTAASSPAATDAVRHSTPSPVAPSSDLRRTL